MSYRCACTMRVAVCCVLLPWRRPVALAPLLFSMTQEILLCLPSIAAIRLNAARPPVLIPRSLRTPAPLEQYRPRAHRPTRAAPPIIKNPCESTGLYTQISLPTPPPPTSPPLAPLLNTGRQKNRIFDNMCTRHGRSAARCPPRALPASAIGRPLARFSLRVTCNYLHLTGNKIPILFTHVYKKNLFMYNLTVCAMRARQTIR